VPQNSIEAVKWYRKSAEQGYARAQSNLGFAYEHGEGGKQVDVAGNDTGKGRSYQPKGGTFYLGIQGIGDWEVSVVPATE